MRAAAANLEFEEAARLRDEIRRLEQAKLGLALEAKDGAPRTRSDGGARRHVGPRMVRCPKCARAGKARRARA